MFRNTWVNLNSIENLFLSCKNCNLKKSNKDPEIHFNFYKIYDRLYRANRKILPSIKKPWWKNYE